ncbi:branched-chain amino acid ABC transporter permease [Thermodesulfobacteriota bacterium]
MEKILEILFNGISMGAIYALIALGFVLIFKSTGVLNFAHGELCMIGAFICYQFATLLKVPYVLSFLIAIALGALLGSLIYNIIFRRVVGEPIHALILITLGLANILTCLSGLIWGHDVYSLHSPFMNKTSSLGKMVFSQASLYTIGASILLFGLFILFFNRSLLGVALKGTAEDSDTAGLMGINVKKMHMIAWTIGTVVAVIAGVFLAEQSFVQTSMSHSGIKAMSAAILGGMESLPGAIIGGLIVGIVESLAASYLSGWEIAGFHFGDVKDVVAFAIMVLVLMIRPHGIFGKEEVERV